MKYEMREQVSDSSEASSSCESEYAGETSHVFDSIDQIDDDCGSNVCSNQQDDSSHFDHPGPNELLNLPSIINHDDNLDRQFDLMGSSPIPAIVENDLEDLSFSDIDVLGNSTINFDNLSSGGSDESEQKLPSMSNFLFCANAIIARHGTSDAAANNWFKLIRTTFPESTIPSYKTLKRNYHVVKDNEENFIRISGQGKRWQLDFVSELRNIVVLNILETFSFSLTRDINTDLKIRDPFNHEMQTMTIQLLLNSDGMDAFKSNAKSLWPVWLAIADLPPVKRFMFKNITLG